MDESDGEFEPAKLNDYDLIYKAIVIGESDVGKTALIRKYQNPDKELPNLLPTIGIDYRVVNLVIDNLRVRTQLWDTVGQERYRTMTRNFFAGAKGVLLMFDVSCRQSFILINDWMTGLKQYDLQNEEVFLIGNKIDLDHREVLYEEALQLARSCGMKYFETSAKTGENVKSTIDQLIHNMKDSQDPLKTGPSESHIIDGEEWEEVLRKKIDDKNEENKKIKLKKTKNKKKSHRNYSYCCYS